MQHRLFSSFRVLALLFMSLALTGAATATAAGSLGSLQPVELTEEVCGTLDVNADGAVDETEASALVELGFNLAGDDAVVIDEADFQAATAGCADLLAGMGGQATAEAEQEFAAHPAHIHSGTCETLGEVAYPLNDVAPIDFPVDAAATPADAMSTPAADATSAMTDHGAVDDSTTTVDVSLEELLSEEYAINAHESAVNIENYIACGDITGEPTDGELTIELMELNDSGHSGEAVLVDNGDGTTTVTITLMDSGPSADATPSS